MNNRAWGLVALLAVIGVSIVFGMVLGGRLNSPPMMFAAPPLELPAASTGASTAPGFADVVEHSLPAVVGVTSTQVRREGTESLRHPFLEDPYFRRFFGEPDDQDPRQRIPRRDIGEGSGFLISTDGYVLTNYHVVEDADRVEVSLHDGTRHVARIVGTDPPIDLALLKIDAAGRRLPTLALGDSDRLRVGEWVIAIGDPLDFDQTVTVGVISGKGRRVPIGSTDYNVVSFIQTDAAINFGNSGGPLLDAWGNVVGISTAIRRANLAEGIGFALPINQARKVIDQLQQQGFVRRGFIGITMNTLPVDEDTRAYYGLPDTSGVIVSQVHEGRPGDRAGLKAEDVIRKVDGEVVRDNQDLVSKIASRRPGDKVRLEVFRKGRTLELQATLSDRTEGLEPEGEDPSEERPHEDPREYESSALGITVEGLGPRLRENLGLEEASKGVVVTDVAFGSVADTKGIQPSWIITAINETSIGSVSDWSRLVEGLKPGALLKLEILQPTGPQPQNSYVFLRIPQPKD